MDNNKVVWDQSLISKYDISGPRYTSYPTAPQFSPDFSLAQWQQAVDASNHQNDPLSLYFHIPFCDTVCYYCGCNKIITANRKHAVPYLARMFQEIRMKSADFGRNRVVDQLHFGGGTPTYLTIEQLKSLFDCVREFFTLSDQGEFSIEVHPQGLPTRYISALREMGFNRLSIGVQDFHPATQKAVNRFNSYHEVQAIVQQARTDGFNSVSMDLIYGLPHQTVATFTDTLRQIIALSPDRLSLFSYAHLPERFKVQRQMDETTMPSSSEKMNILHQSIDILTQVGYVYIGMDHFAKPDDSLTIAQKNGQLHRNFQGYATHADCDLIGFGVSAISAVQDVYAQNYKDIESYNNAVDSMALPLQSGLRFSQEDALRRAVIFELICHFKLKFTDIEARFNIVFTQHFSEELKALTGFIEDGLVTVSDHAITVLPAGRLLIRGVCMAFDAHLQQTRVKYSKII